MIHWPDVVNGLFEFWGSLAVWLNVRRLLIDKMVRGYSPMVLVFFLSWGFWNIFYYAHLVQWFSWACGISMAVANLVYVLLTVKYFRK